MQPDKTQQALFQQIKTSLPQHLSLVNEVAVALSVSNDSAYRRIRGETSLTLDEFKMLCTHFKVTPNLSATSNEMVNFYYQHIENSEKGFEGYLLGLLGALQKTDAFETKKIIMAAKDIPLFHLFQFPKYSAFKMFFWMKSIMNVPEFENRKFHPSLISKQFIDLGKQMSELYIKIPATEIWTEETINTAVRQIEYYWESGFFEKKEDALQLCEEVTQMISHIQKQAELGFKFYPGKKPFGQENNFLLYYSDFIIANNSIFTLAGNNKTTYITHHTFKALVTTNSAFCDETEQWLNNLLKKSFLISSISEKQRNQFFQKIQDNIGKLKSKIEE